MISYAQNREDVVLSRLVHPGEIGRYVDVGAGHPTDDSVTRHFYDQGWRGINIEPRADLCELLARDRPEDVNLCLAIGREPGTTTLHEVVTESWGMSTTTPEVAAEYRKNGIPTQPVEVTVVTLANVLEEHPGPIDFLKIDVEGAELDVLAGAELGRFLPRVIVVEATRPSSPEPAWSSWEPLILDCDYRCALFDGLNRFYVRHDDEEAFALLSVPANVFDDFQPHHWVATLEKATLARESAMAEFRKAEVYARELESRAVELERLLASAIKYGRQLEQGLVP